VFVIVVAVVLFIDVLQVYCQCFGGWSGASVVFDSEIKRSRISRTDVFTCFFGVWQIGVRTVIDVNEEELWIVSLVPDFDFKIGVLVRGDFAVVGRTVDDCGYFEFGVFIPVATVKLFRVGREVINN
jgi:hypothetical protein